ncbi:helix-turn-helix domain-containing protein [Planococcus halotolerans]|uniref:helix-turn-helix domain-containing protein n=1 Tax=Planococcus halotolerans TaxID=2233542 RepID=UPI001092CAA2|nr:helix-turn-helix transcriptional regulator [Planococcus halotolerans]QHJ69221.1 helix-turn-helix domain-containing protein [Planococcus halotolerans]
MGFEIKVAELLGKNKMSQKELAEKTGIRPATISALFHEKIKRIDIDHIVALCNVFNCQPGDIFVYTEDEKEDTGVESFPYNSTKVFGSNMKLDHSQSGLIIKKEISNNENSDENNGGNNNYTKKNDPLYNLTREYVEEILLDILKSKGQK